MVHIFFWANGAQGAIWACPYRLLIQALFVHNLKNKLSKEYVQNITVPDTSSLNNFFVSQAVKR